MAFFISILDVFCEVSFDVLSEGILVVVLGEDVVTHRALLTVVTVDVLHHLVFRQISHDSVADGACLLRGGVGSILPETTQRMRCECNTSSFGRTIRFEVTGRSFQTDFFNEMFKRNFSTIVLISYYHVLFFIDLLSSTCNALHPGQTDVSTRPG